MKRRVMICLFGSMAAAWPLAAYAQSTTHTTQATRASVPKIEVVRVRSIDPAAPEARFQLSDGSVDLMKGFIPILTLSNPRPPNRGARWT
jgi:hypothetical protein